jgi:tRNA pseudouridine55 synthase
MTYADSSNDSEPGSWNGLLVLDKPTGITSRAALDRAAGWFPRHTRIGHAGTLDPLASGVLVLCLGKATRLVEFVQGLPKAYRARVLLGARSDTDDADGVCVSVPDARVPELTEIRQTLDSFIGTLQQVPPKFSAARHEGRRAYNLARKQREFELAPRPVQIQRIDIEDYTYPHLDLTVECGKGTYIRSLARDLGERLGCGGLIASLRRTRIGGFDERDAVPLEAQRAEAVQKLLPIGAAVAYLPKLTLTDQLVARLRQGQRLARTDIPDFPVAHSCALAAFNDAGELALIVRYEHEIARISPTKVMS